MAASSSAPLELNVSVKKHSASLLFLSGRGGGEDEEVPSPSEVFNLSKQDMMNCIYCLEHTDEQPDRQTIPEAQAKDLAQHPLTAGVTVHPGIIKSKITYCPFDQKKIIIFSNLTDLAVTCCVLHSHGE
jgi:hypothetical protein